MYTVIGSACNVTCSVLPTGRVVWNLLTLRSLPGMGALTLGCFAMLHTDSMRSVFPNQPENRIACQQQSKC